MITHAHHARGGTRFPKSRSSPALIRTLVSVLVSGQEPVCRVTSMRAAQPNRCWLGPRCSAQGRRNGSVGLIARMPRVMLPPVDESARLRSLQPLKPKAIGIVGTKLLSVYANWDRFEVRTSSDGILYQSPDRDRYLYHSFFFGNPNSASFCCSCNDGNGYIVDVRTQKCRQIGDVCAAIFESPAALIIVGHQGIRRIPV